MFYVIDYYTEDIIDVFPTESQAIDYCKSVPDSMVETEDDAPVYWNVDSPF